MEPTHNAQRGERARHENEGPILPEADAGDHQCTSEDGDCTKSHGWIQEGKTRLMMTDLMMARDNMPTLLMVRDDTKDLRVRDEKPAVAATAAAKYAVAHYNAACALEALLRLPEAVCYYTQAEKAALHALGPHHYLTVLWIDTCFIHSTLELK